MKYLILVLISIGNPPNSLWNRDTVTSAPKVRDVDEYNEELKAAEKRKKTGGKGHQEGLKANLGPKDKLLLKERPKDKVQFWKFIHDS